MTVQYEYTKFKVLFVDDEKQTTDLICEYLMDTFDVVTAYNGEDAWQMFQENPDEFAVIVTDQRMPGMQGTELLEKIRNARPRSIRILCTAYADIEAAIDAVNIGAIYKYLTKPVETPELEIGIKRAMEFFLIQRERDGLMREKLSALQRLMMTDRLISLGIFAAGLNHHLRNGLTAVKTFLDLAPLKLQSENVDLQDLRNPDYWNQFYHTAQSSIESVMGLLSDVQEIPGTPPAPIDDQVDVVAAINTVIESKNPEFESRSLTLDFEFDLLPSIAGKRHMVERIFDLLLSDEASNVSEGGRVQISAVERTTPEGWPGVQVLIEDSGPGLTASNLQCLFDPFFTRGGKPEEYGLNLLTAFFLVYHHSGTIRAQASNMGGTRFEIFLPLDPSAIPVPREEESFLQRVMETERVWEKKLIGD